MDAATLRAVAKWCDEEYRKLCMLPVKFPDSNDAISMDGRRAQLAKIGGLMRQWASTGREPEHCPVAEVDELRYERLVREDEEMLKWK